MDSTKKVRFVAPRANRGSDWWAGVPVVGLGPLTLVLGRPTASREERALVEAQASGAQVDLEVLTRVLPQEFEIEVDGEEVRTWVQAVGVAATRVQWEKASQRWTGSSPPDQWVATIPLVACDRNTCAACAKPGASLVRLSTGEYEIPCCGGRDPLGVSAKCRHAIVDNFRICLGCGKLGAYNAVGRACKDCEDALEVGWKAQEEAKAVQWVPVDHYGHPAYAELGGLLTRSGLGRMPRRETRSLFHRNPSVVLAQRPRGSS